MRHKNSSVRVNLAYHVRAVGVIRRVREGALDPKSWAKTKISAS